MLEPSNFSYDVDSQKWYFHRGQSPYSSRAHRDPKWSQVSISCVRRFSSRKVTSCMSRLWRCRIRRMFRSMRRSPVSRDHRGPGEQTSHPTTEKFPPIVLPQALVSVSMAAPLMPARCSPPYYDSLLVKVTAWGANLPEACQRMDRALREFRIRGGENEYPLRRKCCEPPEVSRRRTHDLFPRRISRAFFHFPSRGDRATKLLSYLGDVILNGNPEVKGKQIPKEFEAAVVPATPCRQTPGRHAAAPAKTRAKEVRRLGAKRKAPAHYRHDFPRRAPVAHGHARPHIRSARHRRHLRASPAASFQSRDVGWCDF